MELGDASDEEAPHMPKESRGVKIFMVAYDFDAAKHAM